ncbi:ROK family protein [Phreatobacter sp.]|uniref:ROK family protein n=1 Tax=Phreatobacter sp. TaxID=1966341 RepID=UPI003F70BDCB
MVRAATGGTNPGHARLFNRRVVLETIRLHGPLSRAAIARHTGLSVQSISNIAEDLSAEGLLREERLRQQGGRGAPAHDLALNPDGGFTFGIALDHRRLMVVLTDITGRVRRQVETGIEGQPPDSVLTLIASTAGRLADAEKAGRDRIWGAGVVMPMIFENGEPVAFGPTSMPAWQHVPVVGRLSAALGVPVLVENDATAAAVGEQLYGIGRRLKDFFYIYIGVGVGGGMILSGHPYRGSAGRAGELGHVVVDPGGRQCACGNRGCLERYVSLSAAQHALDGLPEGTHAIDPSGIAARVDDLDVWLDEAARHLSTACVTIGNLLDPEAIVVGGTMPSRLLGPLIERLKVRLSEASVGRRHTPIFEAEIDLDTPALGGAALPLFEGLAPAASLLHMPVQKHG